MLYVLHGTDTKRARVKLHSLLDRLFEKKPDASFVKIDDETFEISQMTELIEGQGLFESKCIVLLDGVLKNKDSKDVLIKSLKEIVSSENIFILIEEKIDKGTLSKLEKAAKSGSGAVQEFVGKDIQEKKQFNVFKMTDALGRRNKKSLWVLYQEALKNGVSGEEIYGILFWQIKSMMLAGVSNSASEAGLNPFVFKKSTDFLKNYTKEEIQKLSSTLVRIAHDSRRGIHELDIALERFILGV